MSSTENSKDGISVASTEAKPARKRRTRPQGEKQRKQRSAVSSIDQTHRIDTEQETPSVRAKIKRMIITNFGCISNPVTIDLDKIVVLVGPNNSGKSTILRAYHIVMSPKGDQKLTMHDFFRGNTQATQKPTIEIHTHIEGGYDLGPHWISPEDGTIHEKWTWEGVGVEPKRVGFNFQQGDWSEERPYGMDNLGKYHRPQPWRLKPFDDDAHATVTKFILDHITSKIKGMPFRQKDGSREISLFDSLASIVDNLNKQARQQIQLIVGKLTEKLLPIFPKHQVGFDPSFEPTDDKIRKFITDILTNSAELTFGLEGDKSYMGVLSRQGSGAQRMLMWAALRFEAEDMENIKNPSSADRSHILLIDEPEICLHPSAIRDISRTLYQLAEKDNWQVMLSTHSPVLLDLSYDNTTIVRVERDHSDAIRGTTIFRRDQPKLDPREVEELKLLNLVDPHVTEFFFGGRTILVEGDTEYAAFKYIMSKISPDDQFGNLHIVRARGKSTLRLLAKIMNSFNQPFSVLHDADREFIATRRLSGMQRNSAFTENKKLLDEVAQAKVENRVFLVASIPNFEMALFGAEARDKDEKPEHAIKVIRNDKHAFARVEQLLKALVLRDKQYLPSGCIEWNRIDELRNAVSITRPSPPSQTLLALDDRSGPVSPI